MQALGKIIYYEPIKKIIRFTAMVIAIPFMAYVANLVLLTIYKLGQYNGTFLRNLFDFIC